MNLTAAAFLCVVGLALPAAAQQLSIPVPRGTVREFSPTTQTPATAYTAAETQYFVTTTGNNSNTCLLGSPCLTIQHALDVAMATDAKQGSLVINIGAGTFNESITISGQVPGLNNAKLWSYALSHPQIILRGVSAASTEILGTPLVAGQGYCYTIFVNNGAYVGLEKLSVRSNAGGGGCSAYQSNLYVQLATLYIIHDVTLKAATGAHVMLEESANFYVTPGIGTPVAPGGLTLAGNAYYGIVSAANSMFTSDSTINIVGPISLAGGLLFYADEQSMIKMALANPAVTSGASVTGRRFALYGNSYMTVGHPPAVWPGSVGIVAEGSRYRAPDNLACAGGSAGCNNTTVPTGLGSGGINIAGASGGYGGAIELVAGTSSAASGSFGVGFPYEFDRHPSGSITGASCAANLSNGTGIWYMGATVKVNGFSTITGINITWDNNAALLVSGLTYFVNYICNTTR